MKKEMISGLIVCIIIGILGKLASNLPFVGALGSTSLAIILGIIAGNTIVQDKKYLPGVKFSEKVLLTNAIMLLGATLNFSSLVKLGFKGIIFIILQMIFVICINILVGKRLGFSKNFSLLMGSGNAVCGSSAIAATAPVLEAKEEEIGIPVAVVNLVGTIFMFVLPFLAAKVFKYDDIQSGALIGGGLQSVGQVVAGGHFLNENVASFSILFKMIRISMLGIIVVVYSYIHSKSSTKHTSTNMVKKKRKFPIPPFIIVFFGLSLLVTLGVIPPTLQKILKHISSYLLIIAMAGIGMRVKFKELLSEGPKAVLFGFVSMFFQIILLMILIKLIFS